MSGSASERAIRDYTADRLRAMLPQARVVHELVVGGCRADLAAIEPERITLVEIKSERDTLKRLPEQVRQFVRASHQVIVVSHEKWWDTTPYNNGAPRCVPSEGLRAGDHVDAHWCYPEIETRPVYNVWSLPRDWGKPQPHAHRLLELCWRAELQAECFHHRIAVGKRTTVIEMVRDMAWSMTGAEIVRAVCRQLRQRSFPEADAPILDRLAA